MQKKDNNLPQRLRGLGKKMEDPAFAFLVCALTGLAVIFLCLLASHGTLVPHYLYCDIRDTGMDFFHSIEYLHGRAPYAIFETLYPPLANLLFLVIYWLVPPDTSGAWTYNFWQSVALRGTKFDLRTFQGPMLMFLLFFLITYWLMQTLTTYTLRNKGCKYPSVIAFCLTFSPGMLYALERGNILLLTIPLVLFFILYRNSESKFLQELSLIALAVAAGLKLYPAFFGVLLLRDKQYWKAARAVVYGVLTVVLPMFFFEEGLAGIPMWLSIVFEFKGNDADPLVGTGLVNFLHRIVVYADLYLGIDLGTGWMGFAGIAVTAGLLLASLFMKKQWQSVLAITLAFTLFQNQGRYVFSFYAIPMVMFLLEEDRLNKNNIIPFVLTLLLNIHLPIFYTHNSTYPDIAVKQMILMALLVWCVVTFVRSLGKKPVRAAQER